MRRPTAAPSLLDRPRRLLVVALAAATALGLAPGSAAAVERDVPPMRTYFGTTHAHTGFYNTHGEDDSTPQDVFDAAKASGFDFFLLTEHSGPTGPRNPAQFYADARAAAAASTTPDFVALTGYEFSDNDNDDDLVRGHMTVLGADDFVSANLAGMDFVAFFEYLVEQAVTRAIVAGFNHPPGIGHEASDPALLSTERRRLLALTETHNHTDYSERRDDRFYRAMVVHLDRGWRVAPTCGLDGHGLPEVVAQETSDVKPCRTGVLAPRLTPTDVVSGLRSRRTFSTRDLNLRVRYTANDKWMGSRLGTARRIKFEIRAVDPNVGRPGDAVTRVDVVGSGGTVLATRSFSAHRVQWAPVVPRGRNTWMMVRVHTGDHPTPTALAAPTWMG